MVKSKDILIKLQFLFVFLIPVTPHFTISQNLQLDDIPVFLSLFFLICNFYFKNYKKFYIKESLPIAIFIIYISIQNFILNGSIIYSDNLRFTFYLLTFISIMNIKEFSFIDRYIFSLMIFLTFFSISFYFFETHLGTDSYEYWKIGFNQNEWGFTKGRMNGFQAGGPNAFGGLIACLTIYCISKIRSNLHYLLIFIGIFGCFLTYSRASIIVLFLSLSFYFLLNRNLIGFFILILSFLVTINFGLIERFTSESETEGIQDRIEMQGASIENITSKSFSENLIGYGYGRFGIVRSELKLIDEFQDQYRPTGPHNSFLFMILNYGIIGLILFLNIFLYPLRVFFKNLNKNLTNPSYLFLGSFIALSFTGDFIQNHSVSVLFFVVLFNSIKAELNE